MTPDVMNIGPAIVWVGALSVVLSFALSVWTIFSGPSRKNGTKISEIEIVQGKHDLEIQRLRDKVEGLPNQQMMHRLELSMTRMEGHIDKLDERLKPVAAIAERMQDLLIEQGNK